MIKQMRRGGMSANQPCPSVPGQDGLDLETCAGTSTLRKNGHPMLKMDPMSSGGQESTIASRGFGRGARRTADRREGGTTPTKAITKGISTSAGAPENQKKDSGETLEF